MISEGRGEKGRTKETHEGETRGSTMLVFVGTPQREIGLEIRKIVSPGIGDRIGTKGGVSNRTWISAIISGLMKNISRNEPEQKIPTILFLIECGVSNLKTTRSILE